MLAAKSDLECLQLHPGASRAELKAKYRTMAVALHPDKCKVGVGARWLCCWEILCLC